jgi:methionyl-tRNA formyltransferase
LQLIGEEIDSGAVLAKKIFNIPPESTARELYEMTNCECLKLFKRNINKLLKPIPMKKIPLISSKSYFYKRNSLVNKSVNTNWSHHKIKNFVRGNDFPPFEPAYLQFGPVRLYLTTKINRNVDYREA